MIEKPEPVPRPGMAGGPKAMAMPSLIAASLPLRRCATLVALSCAAGRSSQSLSWMKKNALLVDEAPERKL
ncbi:hypothetical protein D3C80_1260150 [compost metagenome]